MIFQPKKFMGPSILLHLCALGAVLLLGMNSATLKTPKEKLFKVKMVQQVQRVNTQPPAEPTKITKPPAPKKELVKREPPVKKKIVPEKKPELVKREIKPVKKVVKTPVKPERKIMKMPDHIKTGQKKWLTERKKKKVTKKKVVQPKEEKFTPREVTVSKQKLQTSQNTDTRTFDDVKRNLDRERKDLDKRLKRSFATAPSRSVQYDSYYVNQILPAIRTVWITPSAALVPKRSSCKLGFRIARNGRVSNVRVLRSSGYAVLDESAKDAITQARFPVFPSEYKESFFDVEMDFECEPES